MRCWTGGAGWPVGVETFETWKVRVFETKNVVFVLDGAKGKLGCFFYESRGTKNMTNRDWLDF